MIDIKSLHIYYENKNYKNREKLNKSVCSTSKFVNQHFVITNLKRLDFIKSDKPIKLIGYEKFKKRVNEWLKDEPLKICEFWQKHSSQSKIHESETFRLFWWLLTGGTVLYLDCDCALTKDFNYTQHIMPSFVFTNGAYDSFLFNSGLRNKLWFQWFIRKRVFFNKGFFRTFLNRKVVCRDLNKITQGFLHK